MAKVPNAKTKTTPSITSTIMATFLSLRFYRSPIYISREFDREQTSAMGTSDPTEEGRGQARGLDQRTEAHQSLGRVDEGQVRQALGEIPEEGPVTRIYLFG